MRATVLSGIILFAMAMVVWLYINHRKDKRMEIEDQRRKEENKQTVSVTVKETAPRKK